MATLLNAQEHGRPGEVYLRSIARCTGRACRVRVEMAVDQAVWAVPERYAVRAVVGLAQTPMAAVFPELDYKVDWFAYAASENCR